MTDTDQRIDQNDINAWVFGSFQVVLGGGPVEKRVLGADGNPEPANFPGIGVFYGGECVYGLWYNPKGKPTSGSLDHPHPHCVEYGAGQSITVILEPISATIANTGADGSDHQLRLGSDPDCGTGDDLKVMFVQSGKPADDYPQSNTKGCGIVDAWGIDVTTLATTKTRVGRFTFNLDQYDTDNGTPSLTDLFDTSCGGNTFLGGFSVAGCLDKQITATYTDPDGATQQVLGYLYWQTADKTFFNSN